MPLPAQAPEVSEEEMRTFLPRMSDGLAGNYHYARREWTADDLRFLKRWNGQSAPAEIARALGRSASELDIALWASFGRSEEEALFALGEGAGGANNPVRVAR